MTEDERIAWWRESGAYLGYPQCCIDEFVQRMSALERGDPRKLNGTGYVPCQHCNETKTEEEMIATITFARSCTIPFPLARGKE